MLKDRAAPAAGRRPPTADHGERREATPAFSGGTRPWRRPTSARTRAQGEPSSRRPGLRPSMFRQPSRRVRKSIPSVAQAIPAVITSRALARATNRRRERDDRHRTVTGSISNPDRAVEKRSARSRYWGSRNITPVAADERECRCAGTRYGPLRTAPVDDRSAPPLGDHEQGQHPHAGAQSAERVGGRQPHAFTERAPHQERQPGAENDDPGTSILLPELSSRDSGMKAASTASETAATGCSGEQPAPAGDLHHDPAHTAADRKAMLDTQHRCRWPPALLGGRQAWRWHSESASMARHPRPELPGPRPAGRRIGHRARNRASENAISPAPNTSRRPPGPRAGRAW